MHIKNIHIILIFLTFALLALSSPIQNKDVNSSDVEEEIILSSNDELDVEKDSSSELEEIETLPVIDKNEEIIEDIIPTDKAKQLDKQFSIISFNGDDGVDALLAQGGFSDEMGVVDFMTKYHHLDHEIEFGGIKFACSSFSVPKKNGKGYYFGRNLDNDYTDGLIVVSHPNNGDYSSIITSNLGLYHRKDGQPFTDDDLKVVSLYSGLDGINEKGLTVSVNALPPVDIINQETPKADIILPLAIRLLLNKASNVTEAIDTLKLYDFHAVSEGASFHLAITDNSGKAVVVEYINNEMDVIESAINENFYLSKKVDDTQFYPIEQRVRYHTIEEALEKNPTMDFNDVKQTLIKANQDYTEFQVPFGTEWTVIYDKNDIEATYYHRLNYNHGFHVKL